MPKVVFDISLSLDGFMTAANPTPEEPMGPGGHALHNWAFAGDEQTTRSSPKASPKRALSSPDAAPTTRRFLGGAPTVQPARRASP